MKTNLDKFYKNDSSLEGGGIWFDVGGGVEFLIKRFGGFNSQQVKLELAKHYKPYSKQIELGTLSTEKEREITIKVFVNACVLDWKGIEADGKALPFTKDNCIELLKGLPELAETLVAQASDSKNYREDLGNS